MISSDGWLDAAIKMPGRNPAGDGFNAGVNPVKGIVFHSAEGWAQTLLDPKSQWGYYSAQYPWHFSNLLDGRLVQHYSLNVRCWHGSAFNDSYIGIEHEGVSPEPGKGPLLNDAQIANDRLVIAEVSAWKGWRPKRPIYQGDFTATLYEHKETVWFGGTSTSCPNNRIPWDKILAGLQEEDMAHLNADGSQRIVSEGNQIVIYNGNIPVLFIGDKEGQYPGQVSKNFGGTPVYLANGGDPDGDGHGEAFWTLEPRD